MLNYTFRFLLLIGTSTVNAAQFEEPLESSTLSDLVELSTSTTQSLQATEGPIRCFIKRGLKLCGRIVGPLLVADCFADYDQCVADAEAAMIESCEARRSIDPKDPCLEDILLAISEAAICSAELAQCLEPSGLSYVPGWFF